MKIKTVYIHFFFLFLFGFSMFITAHEPAWRFPSEPVHAGVEATGGVIAIIMAFLLFNRKPADNKNLSLAIGFLGMGFLDVFHSMTSPGDSFLFLRSIASLYSAVWFSFCWIELTQYNNNKTLAKYFHYAAIISIPFLVIWGFFCLKFVPVMLADVVTYTFTYIAQFINFAAGFFYLVAALYFLYDFQKTKKVESYALSIIIFFFDIAVITFIYSARYSFSWWFWHFLRIAAYTVVLAFLLSEFKKIMSDLEFNLAERHKVENELVKSRDAAEVANQAKREFLANISHEIRTPMNGIIGMTDIMFNTELTKDQNRYLGHIKNSANNLLELINELLDFSKIEAGKMEVEVIDFSLRQSLEETIDMLAFKADKKGLEMICHIDPEVPDFLIGDPGKLRQIIVNLVGNSIKFSEHGDIVLSVENEKLLENEALLHIKISDQGIGIPPEKQAIIFKPFSQGDGSTTRKYGGTGLGLSICVQLIELMHGKIWVESFPGSGTVFHFTIGFKLQKKSARQLPAGLEKLNNLRVLAVEENAVNQDILREILMGWDMEPVIVSNGDQALALMREKDMNVRPFSLVILDSQHSKPDALATAFRIKNNPDFANVKVLMLIPISHGSTAEESKYPGIDAYICKPIKQSHLLECILELFGDFSGGAKHTSLIAGQKFKEQKPLHFLLAEDVAINQEMVKIILNEWGHTVVIAGNGKQVVEAFAKERFDIILMDVQMPEMDGFAATKIIREKEKETGERIPIIAMTAHAMKGDRERCLEAGMDGYISKPIDINQLAREIEVINSKAQKNVENKDDFNKNKDDDIEIFDKKALLDYVCQNTELLKKIIGLFVANTPKMCAEIKKAINEKNKDELEFSAHALKGAVGNFQSPKAYNLALELEKMGKSGDLGKSEEFFSQLEKELEKLKNALLLLLDELPS